MEHTAETQTEFLNHAYERYRNMESRPQVLLDEKHNNNHVT